MFVPGQQPRGPGYQRVAGESRRALMRGDGDVVWDRPVAEPGGPLGLSLPDRGTWDQAPSSPVRVH